MNRRIIKCISTIKELDVLELNRLNIGVEIQDFTEPNLSSDEILAIVGEYKIRLADFTGLRALHGPFLDLKPASPDKEIRQVSYNRYHKALEIAKELEIDYIIFHSQINPYLNEPFIKDLNNKQNREFWNEILADIEGFDGTILLENIFEDEPSMIKELLEEINLPNIKVNLDIGHLRLGKTPLDIWVKELKEHIAYIHLHWNDSVYDEHKEPSNDNIRYILKTLDDNNINPVISLEYKVEDLDGTVSIIRQNK